MNMTHAYQIDWSDANMRQVAIHSVQPVQPGWSIVWHHREAEAEPFSAPVVALCSASNEYHDYEGDERQHHVVAVTADGDEFIIGIFFQLVADDRPPT